MNTEYFLKRNRAIDIFRALTMAIMIVVNDFGRVPGLPHFLEHGDWGEDMMGFSDFVFPCFLVAVGLSIPFAIENRISKGRSIESTLSHILLRALALITMGVFLVNSEGGIGESAPFTSLTYRPIAIFAFFLIWIIYPKSWSGKWYKHVLQCLGIVILLWLAFNFVDANGNLFAAKWWGILGLIGWSYLFCAVAYLLCREKKYGVHLVWLCLFFIAILTSPLNEKMGGKSIVPFENNFLYTFLHDTLHVDNGVHHLLVMSGVLISTIMSRVEKFSLFSRLRIEICMVSVALALSLLCHHYWIFNKLTPTLPWAFMAIAVSLACFIVFTHTCESRIMRAFFAIIKPAGSATLTVYMVPSLLYCVFRATDFDPSVLFCGFYSGILYCVLFSLVSIWIGGLLELCKIKLKV